MMSISDDKQADVIDAFDTTSRYLDDFLNIDNAYFDNMVSQLYHSEWQLNTVNTSYTEAAFLTCVCPFLMILFLPKFMIYVTILILKLSVYFLNGDVPPSTSYGVYISQLIRFARASSHVAHFNTRNKLLTQKLIKQGYRYHKHHKTFSEFYLRYYELIFKFQVGLKYLLRQEL